MGQKMNIKNIKAFNRSRKKKLRKYFNFPTSVSSQMNVITIVKYILPNLMACDTYVVRRKAVSRSSSPPANEYERNY